MFPHSPGAAVLSLALSPSHDTWHAAVDCSQLSTKITIMYAHNTRCCVTRWDINRYCAESEVGNEGMLRLVSHSPSPGPVSVRVHL